MNPHILRSLLVALGVLGALGACSSTPAVCSLGQTIQSREGNCDAGVATLNGCDESKCSTAYHQCTSADQTLLNNYANCFSNIPVCQPGQELSWAGQILACVFSAADAGTISQVCTNAFAAQVGDAGCF